METSKHDIGGIGYSARTENNFCESCRDGVPAQNVIFKTSCFSLEVQALMMA